MHASPHIFVPQYREPTRPYGLIPPSPPAEQRQKRERAIRKELRTWRRAYAPTRGGVLVPVEASRIGNPLSGGALSGLQGLGIDLYGAAGIVSLQDAAWYYKMGEASGNRLDSTANANNVAPTFVSGSELGNIAGQVGNAAVCWNGVTNYEYFTHASATAYNLSGASKSYTLCGWAYPKSTNNAAIQAKGDGGFTTLEWWLRWMSGASQVFQMTVGYASGASDSAVWGTTVALNAWHFVEGGVDAGSSPNKIFINVDNGTEVTFNLANNGGTNFGASYPFYIGNKDAVGASTPDTAYLRGNLQHIGGWKRRWTPTERTAIWNGGAGKSVFP